MGPFPTLQELATRSLCQNLETIFYKKLTKIKEFLKQKDCRDTTDFYVDQKEARSNGSASTDAIEVLRKYVAAQYQPPIMWREKCNSKTKEIVLGLDVDGTKAEVPIFKANNPKETARRKDVAKRMTAELMLRKLYSKNLGNPILNEYVRLKQKCPTRDLKSESFLQQEVPEWIIMSVDALIGCCLSLQNRWEILRRVPEYLLCRSHFLLFLPPTATEIDFTVCPALLSEDFLEIVLEKTKKADVDRVNFSDCSTLNSEMVATVMRRCRKTLRSFNINRCGRIQSDMVFRLIAKHNISLKELLLSGTDKRIGSTYFYKFFTHSPDAKRLYALDLSHTTLCIDELFMVVQSCKRLQRLNLAETELEEVCYCPEHTNVVDNKTECAVTQLWELNVSCSAVTPHVLSLLVDNNPLLEKLFASTRRLYLPDSESSEIVYYKQLTKLLSLDISFKEAGYEDFSYVKDVLPRSLKFLDVSGYMDVDMSHLAVSCPHLTALNLNSSKIEMSLPLKSHQNDFGQHILISHSLKNLQYLTSLEISFTDVDLMALFEATDPLPMQELVIRGDMLDDAVLAYIVNKRVSRNKLLFMHLRMLHLSNCNRITDPGIVDCDFLQMPHLTRLVIERCSGVRPGRLQRMKHQFAGSQLSLTCFINDERPKNVVEKPTIVRNIVLG